MKTTLNPSQRLGNSSSENGVHFSDQLLVSAWINIGTVLSKLESRLNGLSVVEAEARIKWSSC